jgi:hypothetical protein
MAQANGKYKGLTDDLNHARLKPCCFEIFQQKIELHICTGAHIANH